MLMRTGSVLVARASAGLRSSGVIGLRASHALTAARRAPVAARTALRAAATRSTRPGDAEPPLEASFSSAADSESHDDFKPKVKVSGDVESMQTLIDGAVKGNRVMLFMKGTPMQPMCGFSQQVVRILHAQGVDFESANVLESDEMRQGIKEYSQWPTIPQLYVNGEFVGGCDIVTSMHQSGELAELFEEVGAAEEAKAT
mmetsp:Transcript_101857/g.283730  ORF Transcript_101857/g.283730 Transcript_101857/m.283730 type:complete len:200 (+) Transcript_101857:163-762(+)